MAGTKGSKDDEGEELEVEEGGAATAPKAEQLKLAGFTPKQIEEVNSRFDDFIKLRNSRAALTVRMKDAKLKLKDTMKAHKIPAYGYKKGEEDYVARIVEKDDVVVKSSKPDRD